MKNVAIVLAAGSGKRMNADVKKQYLELNGKPVLFYSLKVFEDSFIDEIVLVTAAEDIGYCEENIVKKYGFKKVSKVVAGGAERYNSVMNGLNAVGHCDYVYIHDGARPFIDEDMLKRADAAVREFGTAVIAMPVKDTIKIADKEGFAVSTPDRRFVWQMQTPQVFEFDKIKAAYEELVETEDVFRLDDVPVTDDAMVMETFGELNIRLVEGSYRNIKITTPEDLLIAQSFLK